MSPESSEQIVGAREDAPAACAKVLTYICN